jgi:hypothetical protein
MQFISAMSMAVIAVRQIKLVVYVLKVRLLMVVLALHAQQIVLLARVFKEL